ncbi:hypothetical protein [Cognaticolwellia aestuarii]|jgi:uncharacterized protein YcfL|uniref:hypothetical protein n=1 Tax=Cognaticolwellia aestuarii TaxID=329993 RepID=UPI0009862CD8|nr:hypothetical protein [Cognaticolwellia aestuarii]
MKKFYVILLSLALVVLVGCKSTIPVPQYVDQPVAKSGTEISTVKDIERSIVRAAASLGWKTKIKSEGEILATLDIRKHQLVVLIKHDDKNLTVTYQSSVNLKYDGQKIHRQYANWVTNLLRAIDVQNVTK